MQKKRFMTEQLSLEQYRGYLIMSYETILYEVDNGVATIKMNRPHVKNAINEKMHIELYDAFRAAKNDDNVKIILFTGVEDSFSSGADLKSFPVDKTNQVALGEHLDRTYNHLLRLLESIEKPTVAYINGTAVGAGLSLALACDFRVAKSDAKLGISFLLIGLIPDAGATFFLPRLVGLGKALELSLGQTFTAKEGEKMGLIHRIGEPEPFVEALKHAPSPAYGLMKRNIKASFHLSLEEVLNLEVIGQTEAGKSPFHHQAIERFKNKRK